MQEVQVFGGVGLWGRTLGEEERLLQQEVLTELLVYIYIYNIYMYIYTHTHTPAAPSRPPAAKALYIHIYKYIYTYTYLYVLYYIVYCRWRRGAT
jgi:hypothetical protein